MNAFVRFSLYTLLLSCLISCASKSDFITVKNKQFIKNDKAYHYIGTNYWYGALLGAESGNRERLVAELDDLKAHGIVNLRVMIGAEGGDQDYTVREPLQPKQGQFDEKQLYLL